MAYRIRRRFSMALVAALLVSIAPMVAPSLPASLRSIARVAAPSTAQADGSQPIAAGDLIVSSFNSQSVDEFTPTGTFVQRLMSGGNFTGSAFDSAGNLYVTDFIGNRILKRDGVTGDVSVFSDDATLGDGTVYDSPESIVFSRDFSRMYISDADRFGPGGGIHVVDRATGKGIGFYPLPSSSGSEGAGESDWLALSQSGALLMTNENPVQGLMQVNQSTGDTAQPSVAADLPNFGYAISVDKNGNLWIGDTDRVLEYTPGGTLLNTIGVSGGSVVFSATFNPAGDTFFAGDLGNGNVYAYDLDGNLIRQFQAASDVAGLSVAAATLGSNVTGPTTPSLAGGGTPSSPHGHAPCTGAPVNCVDGEFWHTFSDLAVPGRGLSLDLTRTYSSLAAGTTGPLGFGWTDSYDMSLGVDSGGSVTITEENGARITFAPTASGGYTAPSWIPATLNKNGDGTFTLSRADQTHYTFSSSGQLQRETDRNGYATTLTYSNGLVATVTDAAGRHLTFTYDAANQLSSVTDPAGRSVSFQYDSAGDLQTATDVAGGQTKFTYDSNHLLLTMTDPRGGVVANQYDSGGRVVAQTDPMNRTTSFAYVPGYQTTITDPNGNAEVEQFQNNLLTSRTAGFGTPQAATWTYQYDPVSLGITQVVDPNHHMTASTYDANGNRLTITDALSRRTTSTYDGMNDLTSVTDRLGVTTSLTYDASGNLTAVTRPLSGAGQARTTTLTYGDGAHPGDATALVDPDGNAWSFSYDANGDPVKMTDPDGDATTYSYDGIGRRTAMVSPKGNVPSGTPLAFTTTYSYDAFGDLTSTTDPLGHRTSSTYDGDRNPVRTTDANGHTTVSTYDADNEATSTTRADGTVVRTGYDANGNVLSQTDAAGATTGYTYDPRDRVISATDPLGRKTSYAYDPAGNRTGVVDPSGQTTTYTYDAADQLTGTSYSDGRTPNVTYGYDADGQRVSMTDGTGTTTYQYDSLNRLTSSRDGAGAVVGYGYDLAGQLTSLTYPSGKTVTRAYDAAGRMTAVQDWLGHTTSFGYDPDSNVTAERYANGVQASSGYDNADRITSIADTRAGATLASFGYTRDNLGQVTSSTPTGVGASTESYSYTALNQLTSVNGSPYAYDHADNLVQLANGTTQTYDAGNELLSSTPLASSTAGPAPVADQVVSAAQETGGTSVASPPLTTSAGRELVLAFVSADGPATPTQGVSTVSGGGLAWSLVGRANSAGGTAEVWEAYATSRLSGAVVTASLQTGGFDAAITVATFTGASPVVAASAIGGGPARAPGDTLTTTRANSLVWAAGQDYSHAIARTPNGGQRVVNQVLDTRVGETMWTQAASAPIAAAGTVVDVGDSAPTADRWDLTAVEIAPAPTGTPGFATDVIRTAMQTTPAASFTSPPLSTSASGELLLAMVSTDGPKQPTQSVTSVSGGGLTWTRAARANAAWGAAEVWQAYAASPLNGAAVTAALGNAPFDGSITIVAFTGAQTAVGATAAQAGTTGSPAVSLMTTTAGSTVWGVGHDWTHAAAVTAAGGQALVSEFLDTSVHDTSWTQQTAAASSAGTTIGLADTGPTADRWDMAAVEVVPAPQKPTGQPTTYTYDSRGNRAGVTTPGSTTTLTYDQANRLTAYGTAATYTYNGDGLRMSKTAGGSATDFAWDESGQLPMLLSDGANSYVYGPHGEPIEQVSGAEVTYLQQDQQGSTRLLTDGTGNVTGTYSYDPFGNATSHTGSATTPLEYDGQYLDAESMLYYLRARFYDAMTGQFVSRDPLIGATGEPYQYSSNSPLNGGDPSGMFGWSGVGTFLQSTAHGALTFVEKGTRGLASGLGRALQSGSSLAGHYLQPVGRLARDLEELGPIGILLFGAIDLFEGEPFLRVVLTSIGTYLGAELGAYVGLALCAALGLGTGGIGLVACPLLVGGLALGFSIGLSDLLGYLYDVATASRRRSCGTELAGEADVA